MCSTIVTLLYCIGSARADLFHAQSSAELAEWFRTIGLDMYSDLVAEKALTGESLAEIVSEDNSHQLVVRYCWGIQGTCLGCSHIESASTP